MRNSAAKISGQKRRFATDRADITTPEELVADFEVYKLCDALLSTLKIQIFARALSEMLEQIRTSPLLFLKSPHGQPFREMHLTLASPQRKGLKNTRFDRTRFPLAIVDTAFLQIRSVYSTKMTAQTRRLALFWNSATSAVTSELGLKYSQ